MRSCLSILFLFNVVLLTAQNSSTFYASTDRATIPLGAVFTVKFTIENAAAKNFSPPDFKSFLLISGPSKSQSTTIINGQQSSSLTLSYQLQANKIGDFTIEAAAAIINGHRRTTSPLKIKIVEPENIELDVKDENAVIARRLMNADTAYVGQQVMMDYVLLTKREIRGADLIGEPDYDQFYVQEPRLFDRHTRSQLINGEPFKSTTLTRRCLFAQFPGRYEMSPVTVQANVLADNGGRRRGFFFMDRTDRVQAVTTQDTLIIKSLPGGAPRGFCGGVGRYQFNARWNRVTTSVDGALSLIVKIQGDGDPKRIVPPELILSDTFQISEPQLLQDVISEQQGRILSAHTYEYLIVPKVEGRFDLDIELSAFNPDQDNYEIDRITLPPITVGPETINSSDREAVLFGEDQESGFWNKPVVWAGGIACVGLAAYLGFLAVGQRKEEKETPAINYTERAKTHLVDAQQALDKNKRDLFYQALRTGIYGYAAHAMNIPISEATRSAVVERFRQAYPEDDVVDRLEQIIVQSEHALYAGGADVNRMSEYYQDAVDILAHLEKHAV